MQSRMLKEYKDEKTGKTLRLYYLKGELKNKPGDMVEFKNPEREYLISRMIFTGWKKGLGLRNNIVTKSSYTEYLTHSHSVKEVVMETAKKEGRGRKALPENAPEVLAAKLAEFKASGKTEREYFTTPELAKVRASLKRAGLLEVKKHTVKIEEVQATVAAVETPEKVLVAA